MMAMNKDGDFGGGTGEKNCRKRIRIKVISTQLSIHESLMKNINKQKIY
jgi:hypothetical protein